jgi:hypothetical protein
VGSFGLTSGSNFCDSFSVARTKQSLTAEAGHQLGAPVNLYIAQPDYENKRASGKNVTDLESFVGVADSKRYYNSTVLMTNKNREH